MSIPPLANHQNPGANLNNAPSIPNFGNHHVKDITDHATDIWHGIKNTHNSMSDTERGYYIVAAICIFIVIALLVILGVTGGIAAIGAIAAQGAYYPLVAIAAASILRARYLGAKRQEWQMPPFSSHVQGNKAAEAEWKRLWDERNKAKKAHENLVDIIENERLLRDVTQEQTQAKQLLKAYEKAEVDFWTFADDDIADEKIDQFNEARTARGEPDLL